MPAELREETPHAPAPASSDSRDWVNFGIAEAAQLNVANRNQRAERHIRDTCHANHLAALRRAERRNRRWWQIF